MVDYIYMSIKDAKYIYCEDKNGAIIGYITIHEFNIDQITVTLIAARDNTGWDVSCRNTEIMIDLRKVKKWKLYDSYEEFFEEFFEIIL